MSDRGGSSSSSNSYWKKAKTSERDLFGNRDDNNLVSRTWQPSWLQYRPILGLLSLAFALGCMMASFAVLFISNGKPVDTAFWVVQPTVYLAIAASLGAFAIRFAMTQAVPVAWWYKALRGRSIRQLQYQWEAGQSPLSAIMRFTHAPWMSAASLLMLLMLVDGAFLQRASTIVSSKRTESVQLNFKLSPELPRGFSGYMTDETLPAANIANAVFSEWIHNTSIPLAVDGCGPTSTCSARIQAPGLAQLNCSKIAWPISNAMMYSYNAIWGIYHGVRKAATVLNSPSLGNSTVAINQAFSVGMQANMTTKPNVGPEIIEFQTEYLQLTPDHGGSFTSHLCSFAPAILEYDVTIAEGNLVLPTDTSSNRVVAMANNTVMYNVNDLTSKQPQTLTYFLETYEAYTQVNASVLFSWPTYPKQAWSFDPFTLNAFAMEFMDTLHPAPWFDDPMDTLISSFNNMMVRGGVKFSQSKYASQTELLDPDVKQLQSVAGTSTTVLNVFKTEFSWFIAAVVIYFIVILAILSLFRGFWLFPKNCTLSPFEVSLAFSSPLFANVHSTAGVDGIVKDLGDVEIAYGVFEGRVTSSTDHDSNTSVTRLAFAGQDHIRAPEKDMEIAA